ncbi:hypothetical protein [Streptomyces europaeiscabiei]|uniref:hypothetical protein n=1 Tax=Streptomyces europaeiscabiei TaxID=146819 RepID=UPI002E286A4D|nr:hypothetical protein [Streptomyces europaeiscabiei]
MTGPCRPTGLRPEDRTDFEAVPCHALDAPDTRDVLRAGPGGVAVRRLRFRASADAGTIVAATRAEYSTYRTALASAAGAGRRGEHTAGAGRRGADAVLAGRTGDTPDAVAAEDTGGRVWRRTADAESPSLVAVLTSSLAACPTAVALALGHLLQLAGARGTLPGSLVAAGWTLAVFAAASTLPAFAALCRTALRGPGDPARPARPEQARLVRPSGPRRVSGASPPNPPA